MSIRKIGITVRNDFVRAQLFWLNFEEKPTVEKCTENKKKKIKINEKNAIKLKTCNSLIDFATFEGMTL